MTDQLLLACGWLTTLRIPNAHDDDDDGQETGASATGTATTTVVVVPIVVGFVVCHGFWSSLIYVVVIICDHDPMTPNASSATHPSSQRTRTNTTTEITVVDNDASFTSRLPKHAVR